MILHPRQNIKTIGTKSNEQARRDKSAFSSIDRCMRKHSFVALMALMNGKALTTAWRTGLEWVYIAADKLSKIWGKTRVSLTFPVT